MKISVESEDLSHAAMRPPASHRRPAGARSGSGQVTETPRVAWRPMTPSALRRLGSVKDGPGLVVSLYVNLDPARFGLPGVRETEIQAVVDAARAEARGVWATLDHDTRQAFEGDLERTHRYLLTGAGARRRRRCHGVRVHTPRTVQRLHPAPRRAGPGTGGEATLPTSPLRTGASARFRGSRHRPALGSRPGVPGRWSAAPGGRDREPHPRPP